MAERDWVGIVATGDCPDCGLAARGIPRADLPSLLEDEGRTWGVLLRTASAATLRARAPEGTWSALEYGAHVRDVLAVFAARVELALAEDRPVFGWWDHEAAADTEGYNDQAPEVVATELEGRASQLASLARGLAEGDWLRTGTRRDNETFTVEALIRFALHEAHHHRVDADRRAVDAAHTPGHPSPPGRGGRTVT
ncbi:MAG TPA: DinB family protein [Acidimicrobiales bacterium]|nr:DinB family protein [Acidimicrobiales bacterium]